MEVGQTSISFKHATAVGELADANAASAMQTALEAKAAGDAATAAGIQAVQAGNDAVAAGSSAATLASSAATEALAAASNANKAVDQVAEQGASITALQNDVNLRVKEGDLINQINVDKTGVLIAGDKVTITGKTTIDDGVIGTAQIANGSINTAQIASAAVGTAQIADAAIGTAQIANAAIGTAQVSEIDAYKINAATLSAISANLGAITAGSPVGNQYPFEVTATGTVLANSLTMQNNYNLVYNSEFYADGMGWDVVGFEAQNTGKMLDGVTYNGSKVIGITTPNGNFYNQNKYASLIGKTISLSIMVKASTTAQTLTLCIDDYSASGTILGSPRAVHTTSGAWERLTISDYTVKGPQMQFYINIAGGSLDSNGVYAEISQPIMVESDTAGDYLPNSAISGGWIVDTNIVNSFVTNMTKDSFSQLTEYGVTISNGTSALNGTKATDLTAGQLSVSNRSDSMPVIAASAINNNYPAITVDSGYLEMSGGGYISTSGPVYAGVLYTGTVQSQNSSNIVMSNAVGFNGVTNSLIAGNLVFGGTGHRIYTTDVGGIYFGVSTSAPEVLHAAKLSTYSLASIKRDIEKFDSADALQSVLDTDIYGWRHKIHTNEQEGVQVGPVIDDTNGGYKIGENILDPDGETINNNNMIGLLFGAVKQLKHEIDQLK